MFCARCGSPIEEEWIACPHCGQRYDRVSQTQRNSDSDFRKTEGWYPNKRQWWVIWIAAVLVVAGLMNGVEGAMFALSAAIVGGLVVWRLQRSPK